MTSTMERRRKRQPMTDPTAEASMPRRSTRALMWARKASSTSLLLRRLMASLRPWATRLEKRKKLKETTSKTRRLRATSGPASHVDRPSRLRWPGAAMDTPTKTAMVKREFTFTSPSRAVTWMLVIPPPPPPLMVYSLGWLSSDRKQANGSSCRLSFSARHQRRRKEAKETITYASMETGEWIPILSKQASLLWPLLL
ncbi:unnamed protein product [Musa acuminata subsp. burmannicoides]